MYITFFNCTVALRLHQKISSIFPALQNLDFGQLAISAGLLKTAHAVDVYRQNLPYNIGTCLGRSVPIKTHIDWCWTKLPIQYRASSLPAAAAALSRKHRPYHGPHMSSNFLSAAENVKNSGRLHVDVRWPPVTAPSTDRTHTPGTSCFQAL